MQGELTYINYITYNTYYSSYLLVNIYKNRAFSDFNNSCQNHEPELCYEGFSGGYI